MKNIIERCGLTEKEVTKLASYIAEGKLTKKEKKLLNGCVTQAIFKDKNNKEAFFSAEVGKDGLFLSHSNYTDSSSVDGAIVLMDTYYGELELKVWADNTEEDYTHTLSMCRAKKRLFEKGKNRD